MIEGGPYETVTVENPRAGERLTFYLTDIMASGTAGWVGVHYAEGFPFETATGRAWTTSYEWLGNPLLPMVTMIDVEFDYSPEPGKVILAGYYSRQAPRVAPR